MDESNNPSAIGYSPAVRTLCGGGGGGGASAHPGRDESQQTSVSNGRDSRTASLRLGTTSASLAPGGAQDVVVAVYGRTGGATTWTIYRADPAVLGGSSDLDEARIVFQEPDGAGGWRTRNELPDLPADLGLRSFAGSGRVILPAPYELKSIQTRPPGFALTTAQHSRFGELATDPSSTEATTTIAAGDTLRLAFTPTPAGGEGSEDCFFIASRPLAAGEFSGRRPLLEEKSEVRPLAFALHQNQPNPFARTTTIGFALSTAGPVKLDVFDLLGRRVRTLANAKLQAGEHRAEWDRRNTNGALVKAGLYFYRIEAGQFRQQRRMVILD